MQTGCLSQAARHESIRSQQIEKVEREGGFIVSSQICDYVLRVSSFTTP